MSKYFLFLLAAVSAFGATTPPLTVTAAPTSVTFTYQIGAAKLPTAQAVSVRSNTGTPAYAVAIAGGNALWLTVSPDSGNLPGSLSFVVNPTSLAVGSYMATVNITIVGVTNPVAVPVTLTVTAAPSTLTLSATTLTFTAPPTPVATQSITLSTNGAPISFTAASGSPWLSVSPPAGVVLPGELDSLVVMVDPTALSPQAAAYTGKITITQAGTGTTKSSQTITVSLTLNSSTPTITSVWPATLPLNGSAQTITLRGTNFYTATTVAIQGVVTPLTTTLLSPTALLAIVPATALGVAANLNIVVSNPAPGGSSVPVPVAVGNVPTIGSIGNVASYGTAAVSPGELVTIFGTNIGPTTPATMSIVNGFVATTLGGVSVTIDGQAAPLLFVSQNQITVQVPYEVTQGSGKQVAVTNGANTPATATVTVASQAPGVFTADGSGAGLAAALNYNATTGYSLNTSSNPVHLGDMVILYLTGEGDYNPTITPRTGLIIPATLTPLPQMPTLPMVTIGGATAQVNYAGPLVGSILGLLQINAVVPATATTGQAVPLIVTVGATAAPTVNLSVHP